MEEAASRRKSAVTLFGYALTGKPGSPNTSDYLCWNPPTQIPVLHHRWDLINSTQFDLILKYCQTTETETESSEFRAA